MTDKRVAVSGYFDPIHVGHLEYLKLAKEFGDKNANTFLHISETGLLNMPT